MKTIRQIAEMIGVDKQRVYRHIRKHCINEAHQRCGVMYYDDAAETQIIRHFAGHGAHHDVHHEAHQTTSFDAVFDALRHELEIKNEQIRELNLRLAESQAALLSAQQTAQAAQALHAGTMQGHLPDGDAKARSGLFSRLFRRQ